MIRFHEFAGSAQNVTVYPGFHFKSWVECDLRERPVGSVSQEKKYIFQCMLMKLRLFWFNYKEISTFDKEEESVSSGSSSGILVKDLLYLTI